MRVQPAVAALTLLLTTGLAARQGTVRPSASAIPPRETRIASARPVQPSLLRGTRPNVLATIQGNALNSANGALVNNVVRLRDARAGRIVDTQTTDRSGLFTFRSLDPGSYIVEIVAHDQAILSASQILSVEAGAAVSAVVKLPFHISPLAGLVGHTVPSAAAVSSAAASSGVMAVKVAGEPVSPQ
jgi:hypothetical protein